MHAGHNFVVRPLMLIPMYGSRRRYRVVVGIRGGGGTDQADFLLGFSGSI